MPTKDCAFEFRPNVVEGRSDQNEAAGFPRFGASSLYPRADQPIHNISILASQRRASTHNPRRQRKPLATQQPTMADADNLCERCDDREIEVNCSCGAGFCGHCFSNKHLVRNPTHRKGGNRKDEEKWKWITGRFSGIKSIAEQFKDDEDAKWFGLHADWVNGAYHVSIVETERLTNTMAASLMYYDAEDTPKRQFPSIASFIGETGAGKSTLGLWPQCNHHSPWLLTQHQCAQ